jgi:hypothetical protein
MNLPTKRSLRREDWIDRESHKKKRFGPIFVITIDSDVGIETLVITAIFFREKCIG